MSRLRRRCFTLLEVLVAMVLFSLVLMIVLMATHTVTSAWDDLNAARNRFEGLLAIDRTVDAIFTNTVPFKWPDETGTDYLLFFGEEESVILTYLHPLNDLADGALRFCLIAVEDEALVVRYVERPPFPEDLDDPRLRRSVLARGVEAVSFAYATIDNNDAVIFEPTWLERQNAPLGIRMTVTWTDGTVRSWFCRTAGASHYERFGEYVEEAE